MITVGGMTYFRVPGKLGWFYKSNHGLKRHPMDKRPPDESVRLGQYTLIQALDRIETLEAQVAEYILEENVRLQEQLRSTPSQIRDIDRAEAWIQYRDGWHSKCPLDPEDEIRAAFDRWYP